MKFPAPFLSRMSSIKTILYSIGLAILLAASFLLGRSCTRQPDPVSIVTVRRDTIVVHDTIHQTKPVPVETRVVDTVFFWVTDTLYAPIPIEQKHYRTADYSAWVSGYQPRLDSINVYKSSTIITQTNTVVQKQRSRWGLGVQVGYGVAYDGRFVAAPYVGLGISYNLLSW